MRMLRLLLLLPLSAVARDDELWLRPEQRVVAPGAAAILIPAYFNGMERLDAPVIDADVKAGETRLAGETVPLVNAARSKEIAFAIPLPRAGVATIVLELQPAVREVAEQDIERLLRSRHAGDMLRAEWEQLAAPRRWTESLVRAAKTFVRVGEPPASDRSWAEPLGTSIELVPERDPTALRAGELFPVRVFQGGAPLAGAVVGFVSEDESHEHVVVTDEDGNAGAPLEIAGLWRVRAVSVRRATASSRVWDTWLATLLVEVR